MCRGVLSPAYDAASLTPERIMHLAVGDGATDRSGEMAGSI
jgi:hypothetical protein